MRETVTRRTVLASALAMPFVLDSTRARADQTFVLGTWGGDYQRLMMENIEAPLLHKLGIQSVAEMRTLMGFSCGHAARTASHTSRG